MIAGELAKRIGNKRYLVRPCFQYQVNEFLFSRVAFDIEFGGDDLFNFTHILITDMSFIRPRMYRYAICAKSLRVDGSLTTSGLLPPRLLRRVANLLMFTLSFVMGQR
jgi:hypothetical protein